MKIIHNNKVISNDVFHCKSPLSQIRGLMFRKSLQANQSLLIEFDSELSAAIHMFFVFFPIDVVWLDINKKVIDLCKNLKPFWPFRAPKRSAKYIIELPRNTINNYGLKEGDQIFIN